MTPSLLLPTQFQQYIHISKYARWMPHQKRRETWPETVDRYITFWTDRNAIDKETASCLRDAITKLEVLPSMRALMTAGLALDRDNVAGFNCSYTHIDHPHKFDEILYLLMCGTGVGFSVERQFIKQLPSIPDTLFETETTIHVADSKIGWASSVREFVSLLYSGKIPKWDVSRVRPSGAVLKVFGGRASGPEPLVGLFRFLIHTFKKAAGRRLTSFECHSVVCKVADIVVVGGVRRSALISLSNLSDDRMRNAKSGQWWVDNGHFSLANNSVAYTERPDMGVFMGEWKALYDSKSGERGIFNRAAVQKLLPERRKVFEYQEFGTNPCSKIVLRSNQLCNLSEVVVRVDDTIETLQDKVKLATILGTLQATLTNFRYVSNEWRQNCEEERLLGVSLTGIMDSPLLSDLKDVELSGRLQQLRDIAIETNKHWAALLGINPATAITCVKPSGTASSLVNSSAGIHARHSNYYIRTVRADKKDPVNKLMRDAGVPNEPDVMRPDSTDVFSFPIQSSGDSVFRDDRTAIEQLELWKLYQLHWCEHKPSVTVSVREHEWMTVGAWCWDNFDILSGVSFLPASDHSYQQAPYQEIERRQYEDLIAAFPSIDWAKLSEYESEDFTTSSQELACVGGVCDTL